MLPSEFWKGSPLSISLSTMFLGLFENLPELLPISLLCAYFAFFLAFIQWPHLVIKVSFCRLMISYSLLRRRYRHWVCYPSFCLVLSSLNSSKLCSPSFGTQSWSHWHYKAIRWSVQLSSFRSNIGYLWHPHLNTPLIMRIGNARKRKKKGPWYLKASIWD